MGGLGPGAFQPSGCRVSIVGSVRDRFGFVEQVEKGVDSILHRWPVSHNVLEPGVRPAYNVAWPGLILW